MLRLSSLVLMLALVAGATLAQEPSFSGTPTEKPAAAPPAAPPPAPPPPAPLVQVPVAPPPAPPPPKALTPIESLNKALGVYVFPSKGQPPDQQDKEMNDCYVWATQQSGVDPLSTPQTQAAQTQTGPDGSAVRGAARGAVVGAAVGAISGNAGSGAAVGATMGGVGGLSARKRKQAQAKAKADADAKNADAAKLDSFKKAYMVCLEGKGYTAK